MTLTDNQTIGLRMQFWRLYAGYTRNEMSKCVHKSPQTIAEWERGTRVPSVENVLRWAYECGIQTDLLIGTNAAGEEEMKELISTHSKMKNDIIARYSWGAEVYRARKQLGYTTRQFAEVLGKTPTWVSSVESGREVPSLIGMMAVNKELGKYDEIERNGSLCAVGSETDK